MRRVCVLLGIYFMTACSSAPIVQQRSLSLLESSVEYVGPKNIGLDPSQYPADVILLFPYISGGIFGSPQSDPLFAIKLNTQHQTFTLDLISKLEELNQNAKPLNDNWRTLGMNIVPAETHIARIGTFPFSSTGDSIGGGGFIDPSDRQSAILVYVDRPCQITGDMQLDAEEYTHNIALPSAGFHWLKIIETSPDNYYLQYVEPRNMLFSIHIYNLINT